MKKVLFTIVIIAILVGVPLIAMAATSDSSNDSMVQKTNAIQADVTTVNSGDAHTEGCGPCSCNCPDTYFLGDYPNADNSVGWSEEAQGVAHDATNWFITRNKDPWILKIPYGFDLATYIDPENPPSEVLVTGLPEDLGQDYHGFDHYGDLDQVRGFLFVPLEQGQTQQGIAVFRTSDLGYLGHVLIDQGWAGWVAYNIHDRLLYSSNTFIDNTDGNRLFRYTVDFEALRRGDKDANGHLTAIQYHDRMALFENNGEPLLTPLGFTEDGTDYAYMQGGVFTPWGDLFLVNGDGENKDAAYQHGGIHLFRPDAEGKLLRQDDSQCGAGCLNYEYHPQPVEPRQEPEGIDFWHLVGAPTGGELHVLLLENYDFSEDSVFLKHYGFSYWCSQDGDSEGDGLTDFQEGYELGTDPYYYDTDHDWIPDGDEVNLLGTNPLEPDSDFDGLADVAEVVHGTDPLDADTDDDGFTDGDEVNIYHTDPLVADSDNDGLSNGDEVNIYHTDPLKADTDSDGLTDGDEVNVYHTDPLKADTDGDGLNDSDEVNVYHTDPLKADTDGDGLTDGDEVNVYHTDPLKADTDGDMLTDGIEVSYGTNPNNPDTDNDGLIDGKDVEFIQNAVLAIPTTCFTPPGAGTKNAMLVNFDAVEIFLRKGKTATAIRQLGNLRMHVDGCGVKSDKNDWIICCTEQVKIRNLIDLLLSNLRT